LTAGESRITINKDQKAILSQGIIDGTLKLMEQTIRRESPRKSATHDSKPYKQSKSAITDNTISTNILTDNQQLPSRPRDFRISLADEERDIGNAELSDRLSAMVRRHYLEHKGDKFPFPRGKPRSNTKLADERRGRFSYYERSRIIQIIEEVLKDKEFFSKIDNAVTKSDIFPKYRKYSIEVGLHQFRENQQAFLNTYKPAIKKYGLKCIEPNIPYINAKDVTDDVIKKTAIHLAVDIKLTGNEKNALYTTGGILFFDQIMQMQNQSNS
jgi:hypothetical protein